MDLELHIDELVLHGFPAGDRHRIAAEVERELTRLISEAGAGSARDVSIESLSGGSVVLKPGSLGGGQIAGAVFQSIRPYLGKDNKNAVKREQKP